MTQTLDIRLEQAVQRRNELVSEKAKLEGRLEAAREDLASVEAECREKGVEPDDLDSTITKLTTRLETLVSKLEAEVSAADEALTPFLKES